MAAIDPNSKIVDLLKSELDFWKISPNSRMTERQARKMVQERLVYALRLVWQGRYSKFSRDLADAVDQASFIYLPETSGYEGSRPNTTVMIGMDHDALAEFVFDKLWISYLLIENPQFEPTKTKNPSLIQRIYTFFAA